MITSIKDDIYYIDDIDIDDIDDMFNGDKNYQGSSRPQHLQTLFNHDANSTDLWKDISISDGDIFYNQDSNNCVCDFDRLSSS